MGKESARSSWRAPRDAGRAPPRQGVARGAGARGAAGCRARWGRRGVCQSHPAGPSFTATAPVGPALDVGGGSLTCGTTLCGSELSVRWAARAPCGAGRVDRTGGPGFSSLDLWSARLFWLSGCACPAQQLVTEVDNLGNRKANSNNK